MVVWQRKKQIIIKKNEEKRLYNGHLWVFSNEIKEIKGNPEAGDIVSVRRIDGAFIGIGLYNPYSLIAIRIISYQEEDIDFAFFNKRILNALELRKRFYSESESFRVVHGESDFLPGLIIDKYNDHLSLQTLSFGMDKHLSLICDVLESIFNPASIIERNESILRTLERLPPKSGILRGNPSPIVISENNILYQIDPLNGQKTGFFLDQRENRLAIRRYSKGERVLDCFCNEGGFSLNAAYSQAREVLGIDLSHYAIEQARHNSKLNNMDAICRFECCDVFEALKVYYNNKERFGLIILDPPSFTKNKRNITTAKKGYREINTNAIKVIRKGGILATASCSYHINDDVFMEVIIDSAKQAGISLRLLEWRSASLDHPVTPAMPETRYLKFGIFLCT